MTLKLSSVRDRVKLVRSRPLYELSRRVKCVRLDVSATRGDE